MNQKLIFWCVIGAVIGSIGDVLILSAARGDTYAILKLVIGVLLYANCGFAWYVIVQASNGVYSSGAAIWSLVNAVIAIIIAICANEKQNKLQWCGFLLIIIGVIIRSVAGLK